MFLPTFLPNLTNPSLLFMQVDMGQCNDAYSAVVVASALAEAFDTDINGLPLSLDLSWLEQKVGGGSAEACNTRVCC